MAFFDFTETAGSLRSAIWTTLQSYASDHGKPLLVFLQPNAQYGQVHLYFSQIEQEEYWDLLGKPIDKVFDVETWAEATRLSFENDGVDIVLPDGSSRSGLKNEEFLAVTGELIKSLLVELTPILPLEARPVRFVVETESAEFRDDWLVEV